jgi:ATP-dependent DNA ligase
MLAHKYVPSKVTFPCFVQPKLNGVRGLYIPRSEAGDRGSIFQSRYGEVWNHAVVAHAFRALTAQRFHLDGEFYRHGMSLQNINSRIGVVRNQPHVESTLIDFNIFDVMTDSPFWKRALMLNRLAEMLRDVAGVQVVKTCEVTSESEADYLYNQWKNLDGYEGMMYRDANATYGFSHRCGNKDNRWNCLLKRKEMLDDDAYITGFNEMICGTTGKPKDTLGSFNLMSRWGTTFSAGSGLTHSQREEYWKLGEERMKGTQVHYRYEMLSDSKVPLKPIIELVHWV